MSDINTPMQAGMNVLTCRSCREQSARRRKLHKKEKACGHHKVPVTLAEYHKARVFGNAIKAKDVRFSCGHAQSFVLYPLVPRWSPAGRSNK